MFLSATGLIRFTRTGTHLTDRSRVVWEEGVRRGHTLEQAYFLGRPTEDYRILKNGKWHYFTSLPIPSLEGSGTEGWIDSKANLKAFLKAHDVRVPEGGVATNLQDAEMIFAEITKPVIVKPEVGSRGRHTITHIATIEELREAFKVAQQLCRYVVVEEHLVGSVYRATYVDGKIVGVLRGDPPRVTGDGVSTIAELIERKNASKHERQKAFAFSESSRAFLRRQGYTPDSILQSGKRIDLTEKIGLSYGGFAAEDFPHAHLKLREALTRAGDILALPLVGFDFISEDITLDPDESRWGIIEANTLPFIDLHHFPVDGEPINVAAYLWDAWERIHENPPPHS